MADTSSLKNRAILFAFSTTPYIATTFAGPAIAQDFYLYSNFRWAFGAFAIITPVIMSPILAILFMNQREAKKQGLLVLEKSERTFVESCVHHFWEFDRKLLFPLSHSFIKKDEIQHLESMRSALR